MKPKSKWTDSVRQIVSKLPGTFTTEEAYRAGEKKLARSHPDNYHIRPKIRQQLQVLRDAGELVQEKRGQWKKIRKS